MPNASLTKIIISYINGGEGGLFGRILAEVMSAFGLYTRPRSRLSHTDRLSAVNKNDVYFMANRNSLILTDLY